MKNFLRNFFEKSRELSKNPRHKKKWQGSVGILVIVTFIASTIVINQDLLASQGSGYGYGYSYGSYAYGYQYSSAAPSAATGLTCAATSSTAFTCTWSAVTTAVDSTSLDNFDHYEIFYSTTNPATSSDTQIGSDISTQSSGLTATKSSLTASTTYYVALYVVDTKGNSSAAATEGVHTNSADDSSGGGGGGGGGSSRQTSTDTGTSEEKDATKDATREVNTPDDDVPSRSDNIDTEAEAEGVKKYTEIIGGAPVTDAEMKVVYFLAYGTTTESTNMTQRERGGVMQDYLDVYGILPANDTDWNDVAKILSSHRPVIRSLNAERSALVDFGRIYKRMPDYTNVYDEWALYYIAYRIRPQTRDINKEAFALGAIKQVYGKHPVTGYEWSLMRAVAYTGAKR